MLWFHTGARVIVSGHYANASSMAIQPAIDQAFSNNNNLEHCHKQATERYLTEENLEQQCFSAMHLIVLQLLHQDLSVTLRYHNPEVDSIDVNGRTALHWAAWRGDTSTVNMLVQHNADVDKTDHEGFTPLSRAAQAGHLDTVSLLLHANASIAIETNWGYQPIHLASRNKLNGHKIVKKLLKAGADPNAYSHGPGTPLHNAANRGAMDTVSVLIACGANIDLIDEDGDTPAIIALYCWNEDIFLQLANNGAKLDIVNNNGYNILQLATWAASTGTWGLLTELARKNELGFVDTAVQHDGHDIQHCFEKCRSLWYPGKRNEKAERASFDQMVESIGSGS